MKHNFLTRLILLLGVGAMALSCTDLEEPETLNYGYAAFHLAKSSTKADQVEFMHDIEKVRMLIEDEDGNDLSQALSVNSKDNQSSEYGMMTDKWQLLAGTYAIKGYDVYVFDKDEKEEVKKFSMNYPSNARPSLKVVGGGMTIESLYVDAAPYGTATLKLVVDDSAVDRNPEPQTRVQDTNGAKFYPFFSITAFDIKVQHIQGGGAPKSFEKLKVKHTIEDGKVDGKDYFHSVAICDTTLLLAGGDYEIVEVKTYFDTQYNNQLAERRLFPAGNRPKFVVSDNKQTEVEVPITLEEASDYVKDAQALYVIWKELGGDDWHYRGSGYAEGSNWEFENRDMDLWLAQPGVQVLSSGRVASINLTGFGAKGEMPSELGQLTELRSLTLGTHAFNPINGVGQPDALRTSSNNDGTITLEELRQETEQVRESFTNTYVKTSHPLEGYGHEMKAAFADLGAAISEDPRDSKLQPYVANNNVARRASTPPTTNDSYATLITSLPEEIKYLKKLTTLYIAYSPIADLPQGLKECTALTDLEIFACPNITKMPTVVKELPKLVSFIYSQNKNVPAATMKADLVALNAAGSPVQLLQMPYQPCHEIPDLTNLKKLVMLAVDYCEVNEFEEAFGGERFFSSITASNNNISSLPVDADGYFVGLSGDFESIGFSSNNFTELPNIFKGNSVYTIGNVDFSKNKISKFQGADDGSWRGVNATTLNLNFNELEEFPAELFVDGPTCSQITHLMMSSNGMRTIADDAFEGRHTKWIKTMDLSGNKLKKLPSSVNINNLPIMYGIDLSYNSFENFAYQPLTCANLAIYVFSGQRDENGNRCMREWPTGIGAKCPAMARLYLKSNDLGLVDDDLRPHIFILDISDNPNIIINVSALCSYIRAGIFFLEYDPEQDIRGCDALELN